jgi:NAD(P)-dependent dehydrogenase (short-subunit alcohol dehydrogenase family)
MKDPMLEQRVVLITGASSGLGLATASLLTSRGFKVFGTSRKPPRDKANGFEMLQLDVTSDESVDACIQILMHKTGRIDVLVNNAGYGLHGAIEETSISEAKAELETNFFGAVRMVKAVLPIMRQQRRGQIINVSSLGGLIANPFQAFYCASKHAMEGYTEALRHEVKRFNIKVSIVEPGWFKTNIGNASTSSAAAGSVHDCSEMYQRFISIAGKLIQNGGDPRLVAETILRIVESDSPRIRYLVGKEKWYARVKPIVPESMFESMARRYWNLDG